MKTSEINVFNPQSNGLTCWAATIANALGVSESTITELRSEDRRYRAIKREELDILFNNISQPHKEINTDYWKSVKACIDNDRVIVYCFPIITSPDSHFVNIYGYEENDLGKWFYIYDPKPDMQGGRYLLNYENFLKSVVGTSYNENNLKGVFYFGKKISVPKPQNLINSTSKPRVKPVTQIENINIHSVLLTQTQLLLKADALILIKNENKTISDEFKKIAGIFRNQENNFEKDPIVTLKDFINTEYANAKIGEYYPSFNIIRSNYFNSNFIPIVERKKDKQFRFLTALTQSKKDENTNNNYFDSIFSIDFLNNLIDEGGESLNVTILKIMKIDKTKPTIIYKEGDDFQEVKITYQKNDGREGLNEIKFPINRINQIPNWDIRLKDIINVKTNSLSNMDNVSLDAMKEQVEMNVEQLNNLDKIISNEKLQKMDERIKGIPRE